LGLDPESDGLGIHCTVEDNRRLGVAVAARVREMLGL
jgi:hypothetical protein